MKKSTIHLSLPVGSKPPEAHVQVDALTVAHLSTRATAGDVSKTTIASMTLAGSAAAAADGQPDMTIDFKFLLGESREARARLADVRAHTQAIAGMRLALASRSPATDAEREKRAARLAAGDAALAATAATLAKLEALCGMSSGQLTAEVVTRALAQQAEPSAPAAPALPPAAPSAPTAPAAPSLPPGVTQEDAEWLFLGNQSIAGQKLPYWIACALAAHAIGREFTVPRPEFTVPRPDGPKSKPAPLPPATPPPAIPPSPAPSADGPGAVDKPVASAVANEGGPK